TFLAREAPILIPISVRTSAMTASIASCPSFSIRSMIKNGLGKAAMRARAYTPESLGAIASIFPHQSETRPIRSR
ncbi:hypothetical protein PMAYCL1PPCAC_21065, partial [Pristionchus mayeri]